MFLSELIGKTIFTQSKPVGVCRGIALSLKTRAIKYLAYQKNSDHLDGVEFFLPVSAVVSIDENGVCIDKSRSVIPKNVRRLSCGKPVYSETGAYLGIVTDLLIENFYALEIVTDRGVHSALCLFAIGDAVIVKAPPYFPLGQPVPKSFQDDFSDPIVTKTALKKALKTGSLIRFTLDLLPVSNL